MTATVRRDGAARDGAEPPPELAAAIRAAIGYLGDLLDPPAAVLDGRLDRMLRAAVTAHTAHHGRSRGNGDGRVAMDEAAAAVRTACAHLAARELEDAYLALRAAADRVPRPTA